MAAASRSLSSWMSASKPSRMRTLPARTNRAKTIPGGAWAREGVGRGGVAIAVLGDSTSKTARVLAPARGAPAPFRLHDGGLVHFGVDLLQEAAGSSQDVRP